MTAIEDKVLAIARNKSFYDTLRKTGQNVLNELYDWLDQIQTSVLVGHNVYMIENLVRGNSDIRTEIGDPVMTYSSTGGTINISNRGAGQFIISGSTSTISAGKYYYDFEVRRNNTYQTIMSGAFIVSPDYTR
jgi:hypothetical protein